METTELHRKHGIELMDFVWAAVLLIIFAVSWILTLLGMPGNWVMVAAAIGYIFLVPAESPVAMRFSSMSKAADSAA